MRNNNNINCPYYQNSKCVAQEGRLNPCPYETKIKMQIYDGSCPVFKYTSTGDIRHVL